MSDPSEHAEAAASGARRLDADGRLASDLWIDRPTASLRLAQRVLRRRIRPGDVPEVRRFLREGWAVIRPRIDPETFTAIERDVERLWRDRPDDVAFAYRGFLRPMASARPEERAPSCRIADLHSVSAAARSLFLHREVFRWIEMLFGAEAVATQSLYFEWGSHQPLHRDPIHVKMPVPAHLLAAWFALEDIDPDSGPLLYVPGSHRLPYYEFAPGVFEFDPTRFGDDEAGRAAAWDADRCREAGLEARPLVCRRGDVLIWHHSLLHGGSPARRPERTRKSFVVHFSTRGTMERLWNTYARIGEDGRPGPPFALWSEELLEAPGARGFDAPIHAVGGLDTEEARRRAVGFDRADPP